MKYQLEVGLREIDRRIHRRTVNTYIVPPDGATTYETRIP